MYSLGMRGSWWEKTFCRPTSHMRIFLLGFWLREFPMTWNSMTPRLSSNRAASSRAEWADRRLLVWTERKTLWHLNITILGSLDTHILNKTLSVFTSGPSMAVGSVMVDMTSLISSTGMSPTTRGRLLSSWWDKGSEGFRFSPPTVCTHHKHA